MIPRFRPFYSICLLHNKKRGYPHRAHLSSEAYHSLAYWRTMWYPPMYCWNTRKCAQKVLRPSRTQRDTYQHTRGIILNIVFGKQSFVVISDDQSTKHRVTLFHYVVFSSRSILLWIVAGEQCKFTTFVSICKTFFRKMWCGLGIIYNYSVIREDLW